MNVKQDPTLQGTAQPPPGEAAPGAGASGPGWDLDNDALAHAISWLTRHHGRERTPESLLAGLPVKDRLGPDQAQRALRAVSYTHLNVYKRQTERCCGNG